MHATSTFMRQLARDKRGNTIAIMGAAMVPLMGFTGSAIDVARLYVVKTRLQQACDAGALAGRKAMTDTTTTTPLDDTAKAQAQAFFANNFPSGWYQTKTVSFVPQKSIDGGSSTSANAVSATAKATVPMAVMGFFGMSATELTVTCQARFDLADTDIMFVLDTTGSMGCEPSAPLNCGGATVPYTRADGTQGYHAQEATDSKMEALRKAVILFDDTMRANADSTTNFRYGFVTYSSSVNVGKIIPSQYLQSTSWNYQTRKVIGDYNYGGANTVNLFGVAQADCVAKRDPATGYVSNGSYYRATQYSEPSWSANNGGKCQYKSQEVRALWRYGEFPLDISTYVTGAATVTPGRLDGLTTSWQGCIEEVNTSADASFNVNSLPDDLNPDFKPSADDNKWRPIWPAAKWLRSTYGTNDFQDHQVDENNINQYEDYTYRPGSILDRSGSVACGMPAQRLKVWTKQQVYDYVYHTDFKPYGGTYHDVGMIWGTRMLSPDGIFAADTAAWPGRNDPSRNIIFMTDGQMSPSSTSYGQYGVETWDQRIAPQGANIATLKERHNARFRIECDAAKKKGYTVYVVALGLDIGDDLTYCASPGQTFQASSTDALKDAFKTIAQRVAMLRITQ
jgi:Flp pilus assembly protein TadG